MLTKSRIPTHRPPARPGDILLHDFIEPKGLSQSAVAEALGIPFQRLNGVVKGRRAVTPSTALRLARYFGTSPDVWLNLQAKVDLYGAHTEKQHQTNQAETPTAPTTT